MTVPFCMCEVVVERSKGRKDKEKSSTGRGVFFLCSHPLAEAETKKRKRRSSQMTLGLKGSDWMMLPGNGFLSSPTRGRQGQARDEGIKRIRM